MFSSVNSVVCWRWEPKPGYRSQYEPATVNTLAAMVRRHYPHPHRFICVTDNPHGLDPRVEVLPAWNDYADLPSPHGEKNPSCYRRLRMFHPKAAEWFGERFVSLDLDVVITGDLTPLWHRPEDIVLWGDTNRKPGSHYNGSMILLAAGSRPHVWTEFHPITSPRLAKSAQCWGSDQGWISYCLGPSEANWSTADGVYSFRNNIQVARTLPPNTRMVIFHGAHDPWSRYAQQWPFVRKHYRADAEVAA
jgi:hypothetical protein